MDILKESNDEFLKKCLINNERNNLYMQEMYLEQIKYLFLRCAHCGSNVDSCSDWQTTRMDNRKDDPLCNDCYELPRYNPIAHCKALHETTDMLHARMHMREIARQKIEKRGGMWWRMRIQAIDRILEDIQFMFE